MNTAVMIKRFGRDYIMGEARIMWTLNGGRRGCGKRMGASLTVVWPLSRTPPGRWNMGPWQGRSLGKDMGLVTLALGFLSTDGLSLAVCRVIRSRFQSCWLTGIA